jgi:hypothetical protein
VLAPYTATYRNFCNTCHTSSPLRRIFSSSAAVFRTIIRLHRIAQTIHLGRMGDDVIQSSPAKTLPASG